VRSSKLTFIVVLLVSLAGGAALGSVSSAAAANEIAYDCNLDICLLDPANPSVVTNLTDNEGTSIDEKPIWSPNGKKVAFISNFGFGAGGTTRNLFVMEPEAPEQGFNLAVQVTHFTSGVPIEEPVWSPDGTRLAFVYGSQEQTDKVEVANSDGTTATPLVIAEHGVHPTWAPESGKIAYAFEGHVYVEEADGAGFPPPLAGAAGNEPVWSPDGSRIAFGAKTGFSTVDLGIVPAAGGTPTTLLSGAQFIFASWSPSGSQLVYQVNGGGEDKHWRVTNADGSGDHALPEVQDVNPNGPEPSWSPDGTRIVYQGSYYGSEPHTNGVYMQNADGSGAVIPLVQGEKYFTSPSWRPNPATAPQVFTPAGASPTASAPLPVTQAKPTTVWITKRIFVTKGPDLTVIVGSYGCDAPTCGVATEGKAKSAQPAGLTFSLERTRTKPKSKPRQVVVGKGKTTILGGQSGPVKMRLTKPGIKLLEKQGSLKIAVTVTITSPGQAKIVEHRQVTVALKKPAKKKHGA
jgi:Tol biopolymer transport system component